MTIILQCDQCTDPKNTIDLRVAGVFAEKDVSKTGWSNLPGGLHICKKCNDFINRFQQLEEEGKIEDEEEKLRNMKIKETMDHSDKPTTGIDELGVSTGDKGAKEKVYACRYYGQPIKSTNPLKSGILCTFTAPYFSSKDKKSRKKQSTSRGQVKYHEETKHLDIHEPLGIGQRRGFILKKTLTK